MGRKRRRRTSDRKELNGGGSSVVLDRLFSGSEIENCNPVGGEEAASGITVVGLLLGLRGEGGVLSGEDGLEDIFEGEEIGDRKVTTELVGGPN